MFERYSDGARRIILFARDEAGKFGTANIDTEHLLLGMLREAADLLASTAGPDAIGIIRKQISQEYPLKDPIPSTIDLPFSEAAIRVLTYAADEADQLGSRAITPKYIMIGLLREENCTAQRILSQLGVNAETIRRYQESFAVLRNPEKDRLDFYERKLEVLPEGYGLLRSPNYSSRRPEADDIYVSPSQIRRFHLHTGDIISGQIRMPERGERYRALVKVDTVNFEPPQ